MTDPAEDGRLYAACARRAMRTTDWVERAESFLEYLEAFPLGRHNRRAAESIEAAVLQLDEPHASRLTARLRNLRDPHMPPVDPDSCDPSMPSE